MISIKNIETFGWEVAIRGMRNPMNSWDKSDSFMDFTDDHYPIFTIGENDLKLMEKLSKAGSDHGKFLRMINVTMDITAPLYWWKEYDTYKVGTVANSCSTMHKIMAKEFVKEDFSFEELSGVVEDYWIEDRLDELNGLRECYLNYDKIYEEKIVEPDVTKEHIWYALIQMLPSSYNQKRTVQVNYAVLKNMYHSRKNHKLKEWREFCRMIETLPYSQLITC